MYIIPCPFTLLHLLPTHVKRALKSGYTLFCGCLSQMIGVAVKYGTPEWLRNTEQQIRNTEHGTDNPNGKTRKSVNQPFSN